MAVKRLIDITELKGMQVDWIWEAYYLCIITGCIMPLSKIVDLVKLALPDDVHPGELWAYAPQELWEKKPYAAMRIALKTCPRFNWEAYLARNEDVKNASADPCLHYIENGIYEGRKLISWNRLKVAEEPGFALVSVVLINYNNSHYLRKSIESVLNQTLRDIEIIIVDDCSTDESLEIIQEYATQDKRICVIVNEKNSATLITRKRGVMSATGRYIMFLDSDDYLALDACETAAREISKGYDMVKFGAHVYNSMRVSNDVIAACTDWCNRGENIEYTQAELLTRIFVERKVNWLFWESIYLREIVVAAFNELPDERLTGADDVLAVLAISRHARGMLKIADRLYYYNYGPGVSLSSDKQKIISYLPALCASVKHIRNYAEKYSMNIGLERLYAELCDHQIQRLLSLSGEERIAERFAELTDILGFYNVLKILIERHGGKDEQIAAIIRKLPSVPRKIKHIGIYYPSLGHGGVEVIIQTICHLFINDEYQITVFAEKKVEDELVFPEYVKIVYIFPPFNENCKLFERMWGFANAVIASGIDVMLHAGTWSVHILWDVLVLHQYAVPVIFLYHFNFALSLIRNGGHSLYFQDIVFRCAEAVTCLSTLEEMYLRQRSINAIYIPNPIQQFTYEQRNAIPAKIAVIGRFGSWIKQVGQALKVMQEVVRQAPWMTMYLIGDFYTEKQKEEYSKKIKEYGLENNVVLTGWTNDTSFFIKQCGVFLSTSYWEAFPLGIAEAQAQGLPCVIYDLTIEQAKDNPAIIKVPQGDYKKAALEILSLYDNPEHWRKLSQLAAKNCERYSPEIFKRNLTNLLNTFECFMPIRKYGNEEYQSMANNMSFYSKYKSQDIWS